MLRVVFACVGIAFVYWGIRFLVAAVGDARDGDYEFLVPVGFFGLSFATIGFFLVAAMVGLVR